MPKIFDSHCHYNLPPLYNEAEASEWQTHWQKAQENGVEKSVVIGVDIETSARALQIAKTDANLFAAVGIHPVTYQEELVELLAKQTLTKASTHILANQKNQQNDLEKLLSSESTKIVAIGETGLDYFHLRQLTIAQEQPTFIEIVKNAQQEALRFQLQLANEHHLSLIIHCRDLQTEAYYDVLKILKEKPLRTSVILHCISGPLDYVQQAIELGAYIGMAGNSTYKNAESIRDLIRATPANRRLLETDAPYLPPQTHRGHTCQPWMIRETAEFLAAELNLDLEQTYQNTCQVFQLPQTA